MWLSGDKLEVPRTGLCELKRRAPGICLTDIGLKGKSTVEAAGMDDQPITLRVRMDGSQGSRVASPAAWVKNH